MPLADMCDSGEEKQLKESSVGIDDVSGEPTDPSLIVENAAGGDARIQRTRSLSSRSTMNR